VSQTLHAAFVQGMNLRKKNDTEGENNENSFVAVKIDRRERISLWGELQKNGQATYIAPLQPSTLATFRSWGSSTGAGRIRLAQGAKLGSFSMNTNEKCRWNKNILSR